jgi:hypothetical protein
MRSICRPRANPRPHGAPCEDRYSHSCGGRHHERYEHPAARRRRPPLRRPAAIPRAGAPGYLRIATEEAFATRAMLDLYRKLLASKSLDDPGFHEPVGLLPRQSESARHRDHRASCRTSASVGSADMDDTGIDVQVLSLTGAGRARSSTQPRRTPSRTTATTSSRPPSHAIRSATRVWRPRRRRIPRRRPRRSSAGCASSASRA